MKKIEVLDAPPADAVQGQLFCARDRLTNGKVRLVTMMYNNGRWIAGAYCLVHINSVALSFPHYRDVARIHLGNWPESDVAASIEQIVRECLRPGEGVVAHVADFNYATYLFLLGSDGCVSKIRVSENDTWGLINDDSWESIDA